MNFREELLHPAVSHFPIACLVMFSIGYLLQVFLFKKGNSLYGNLVFFNRTLLFFGASMLLPTLFLGDMAFDVIKENLCDITPVYRHEELGETCLIIFLFTMAVEISAIFKSEWSKYTQYLVLILTFYGVFLLFKTSHLGAELVFEQGAAVNKGRLRSCQSDE